MFKPRPQGERGRCAGRDYLHCSPRHHSASRNGQAHFLPRSERGRLRSAGGRTLCRRRTLPQKGSLLHDLIFAHCKFLTRPTIQGNLTSRTDWWCIEEICGLRMCHSAHHGNCSLVINESGGDHPLRAGRRDCGRRGITHCRQGDACEVSEAGSKSTDLVGWRLLSSRNFFNISPVNLAHSQTLSLRAVSFLSIGVTCFSNISSVSDMQSSLSKQESDVGATNWRDSF